MALAKTGVLIVAVVALSGTFAAQQQRERGGDRRIVERSDIAGTNLEAVGAVHTWAPGTATSRHTHPGEMVGFVTRGSVVIEQRGRPTLRVKAGESFVISAGIAHETINEADVPAEMFVTYVVPKNTALSNAAQ